MIEITKAISEDGIPCQDSDLHYAHEEVRKYKTILNPFLTL